MPNWTIDRIVQLLNLGNGPIPGDRVRITTNANNKTYHDCIGRIDRITNIQVILDDGRSINVTPRSVEALID